MIKSNPSSTVSSVVSEVKSLSTQAKTIREKIAAIKLEISQLENSPVCLQDFEKYLRLWIEQKGQDYSNACFLHSPTMEGTNFSVINKRSFSELENSAGTHLFWPFPGSSELYIARQPVLNMMCFLIPERVFEKLFTEMEERCGKGWGSKDAMPIAQRVTRIQELNREIQKLNPSLNAIESEVSKISGLIADASS